MYPNPAQSHIQLSNALSEEGIVYFYNTYGVLIGSQEWKGTRTPEFSLNGMQAGFYTCKFISNEEKVFAGKLLITE
ncbi:MAG: T9SS type A sorting domain-containing protein [Cytophagales bacterium]|nr:T9SS type A sorting domain-containing protein [Cytophaga sp.]